MIADKIDKDKDGRVTGEELKDWILYTQKRCIRDDVERQWKSYNPEEKEKLSWAKYSALVFGNTDEQEAENYEKSKVNNTFSYVAILKRERRRWQAADLDDDDALTKEEFAVFLHAEEADMKDIIVLAIEDIDEDEDGKISDFIGDIYDGVEGEEEPEWIKKRKGTIFCLIEIKMVC